MFFKNTLPFTNLCKVRVIQTLIENAPLVRGAAILLYYCPALLFELPFPGFEGSIPLTSVLVPSAGSEPFPNPLLF